MRYFLLFLVFSTSAFLCASAQTVGSGEVAAVESKAQRISANRGTIQQYKSELTALEAASNAKLQKLQSELAALYKERDDIIADMKVGAKCSKCNTYKSEFEKRGESFEKHLGDVQGYAVPATTTELETTRQKYTEKIAYKKVQIQAAEKGDSYVVSKRNSIATLEKTNQTLCEEITAHSKRHQELVFAEAKSKHKTWVESLMDYASVILISEDKISIQKARIITYGARFRKEAEQIKSRVKQETMDRQSAMTTRIAANEQSIRLLQAQVLAGQSQTPQPDNTEATTKIATLLAENQKLKSDAFQLGVALPQLQTQEVAKVKPAYDQQQAEANQAVTTATTELARARRTYAEKAALYKASNVAYGSLTASESERMLVAARPVNCTVWNEIRFMVATNWNQVFPCVNAITTLAKPYSTHVFNSYCAGTSSPAYLASYKAFLDGLNSVDREAVKATTNATWFEVVTK